MIRPSSVLSFAILSLAITSTSLAEESPVKPVDFATQVMPILKRNCLACHHQQEAEGGLVLETLASIHAGGDSGPGATPKDLESSSLWTRASGEEDPIMPPPDNSVGASPLTAEELALLRLWIEQGATGTDASASEKIVWQPIPASIRATYAMDVSPDNRIAAVARANRVLIVDLQSTTEVARLSDPSLADLAVDGGIADVDLIQSIAFSPDGDRIATGGFRTVRIWKRTPAPVSQPPSPLANASGPIAISQDQTRAAFVNAIGDVEIWDLNAPQKQHTLTSPAGLVTSLGWANTAGEDERLFVARQDGHLAVWNGTTGAIVCELQTDTSIAEMAIARDASTLVTLTSAKQVRAYQCAATESVWKITPVHESVGAIADATAIAATPTLIAIASESAGVLLVDPKANTVVRKIDHGAVVDALAVSLDDTQLATAGRDGKTRSWNLADGKALITMQGTRKQQLRLNQADQDVVRQNAIVAALNAKTATLEALLKTENEALAKVTQAKNEATEALAAATKKHADAVALVATTQATLKKANEDAAAAEPLIATVTKQLHEAKAKVELVAKQLAEQQAAKVTADAEVAKAQAEVDAATKKAAEAKAAEAKAAEAKAAEAKAAEAKAAEAKEGESEPAKANVETTPETGKEDVKAAEALIAAATKQLQDAKAKLDLVAKEIAAKQAEKTATEAQVTKLQAELDAAMKKAVDAKALSEKSTKDLVAQNKAVTDTEAAKTKSESDLANRQQALASATSAQQFAAASIPKHQAIVASETRHGEVLTKIAAAELGHSNAASNGVIDVDFHGDTVATAHRDGSLRWYSAGTGTPLGSRQGIGHDHVAIIADQLVGFSQRSTATIVSTAFTWQLERTIGAMDSDTFADRVTALDFRRDGLTLAVGGGAPSRSGEIKIFAVETGELLRDFGSIHSDTVLGLDFSPDGTMLASASADKTIRLLDIATQTQIRTLEGHTHHVLAVAWQQNGSNIVSASADQTIKAWDSETGQSTRTVGGFPKEISALDFVQATDQVAAAGSHGEVRLVKTSNGGVVRTFKAPNDFLYTTRVTPDGGKVLASGQNGHLLIWNLADGKLIGEMP